MGVKKSNYPKRGEVWWINFDPAIGTEANKIRPAIIVSNDKSNEFLERIQVIPLTSNIGKIYPSEAVVSISGGKSKAAADQIATVSKRRVYEKISQLTTKEVTDVENVIKIQLGL